MTDQQICLGSGERVDVKGDTTQHATCSVCKSIVTPVLHGRRMVAQVHMTPTEQS